MKIRSLFESLAAQRVAAGLPLALSLLLAASCSNTPTLVSQTGNTTPSGNRAPQTQYPMPPANANRSARDFGFTLLDGRRVKMGDYAGKVLVLDFWATYCPPCREEIPQLIELQRRFGAQGVSVVGLNVGGDEDRPKVAEFVKSYRIQYTLGYPDDELTNLFLGDNDSIPQTIVFDRRGRLVKHFVGYDKSMPSELEEAIQTALATD